MPEYLILIAAEDERGLSPAEEQNCKTEYGGWAKTLGSKHVFARRLPLNGGALIKSKRSISTDGPFIEAKELIAGFVLIQAESLDEAKGITRSCPLNQYFHLFVKETK